MARHPYTSEERAQIFARFIVAANQLMEEKGVNAVTIRRVAELAGYKSSTLYHYFSDQDHLIMYASMKYFQEYNRQLAIYITELQDPYLRFRATWEFFCDSAFRHPDAFYRLFFGRYSDDLEEIIRVYYEVFPDEMQDTDPIVREMLQHGSLLQRNMSIMRPLVECGKVPADRAELWNEIIVHCFRVILEEKMLRGDALENAKLIERLQDYIGALIERP
ncbi:TetR/AcrR family transcriptional regulator [Pseudoflavonifractor sp. MCC625]|uniref:TetR/AcrR family transcriptional regulator n=1 Tax=Pseudoflavonifractor sp. MCC625 TaxID=2592647 RepID=UPI002111D024|nr:TetR/AcrR family transcriptional regulator [Pseudoflavonifractor sp. MCC625]MBT9683772.1 TetR family transcriptional regulator [Pseudoflavonifractor sp. MCC625]